jgi:RluA family pseudouridine synthase
MALPPVIYEDEALLAFDKPSGLLVAPDRWDQARENLMALVLARFGPRVANVHRLDADTSGVLLCAKTKVALDFLSGQFQAKTAERIYHALVAGAPAEDEFVVELALREDENRPSRMCPARKGGRPSATRFEVRERFRGFTWLVCRPLTVRTHQIRVHLAARGLPILNDTIYGNDTRLLLSGLKRGYKGRADERPLISRLALHASELTVRHPETRAPVTLRAPLPNEFVVALKYLSRFGRA